MKHARAGRKEWIGLGVLALPCVLYSMDLTVLDLAIPRISTSLQPSGPQLLWIVDIYGFVLAGFLLPMGNLGDRIGRRRLMLIGAIAFGAASVFAAVSSNAAMLIAARAVLGVAAATLAPSTLSLIRNMFLETRQRTVAVSVWVTSFAVGAALGPLLGGILLARFWWGSVFLLAVPVMALLLVLGPLVLPEFRDGRPRPLDLVSSGLSLVTVLLVIYGVKQFAQDGLTEWSTLAMAGGLATGAWLLIRQRRLADPFLDLRLFRIPRFSVALAINLFGLLAFDGAFLFVAQYLQLVAGLSPMEAGLLTLPWAAGLIVASLAAPYLVRWLPLSTVISASLVVAAAGFVLLTQVSGPSGLVIAVVASVLFALGVTPAVALATDLVVSAVPPERAGTASGLTETSTELGGALGIALLGAAGLAIYRLWVVVPSTVPLQSARAARNTLGGALAVAGQLPSESAAMLRTSARDAFTTALHLTGLMSAVIVLAIAIPAFLIYRTANTYRHEEP